MRNIKFTNGEFYHIYNRGNNKRPIFLKPFDLQRFLQSMVEFNIEGPIGSIYANSFKKDPQLSGSATKLGAKSTTTPRRIVDFVCYCLNFNHFHFLIRQARKDGIKNFMHKLGTGYTRYFNEKNKLSGGLFQGKFKAIHVDSNDYLLHISAYINLNDKISQLSGRATKLRKSSWNEYADNGLVVNPLCKKDIILSQFKNKLDYENFAREALVNIRETKDMDKSLELLLSDLT